MDTERTIEELAADYVAGSFSAEEADEFARRLGDQPELSAEVGDLEQVVGLMLDELPMMEPPSHLRDRILDGLEGVEQQSGYQLQPDSQLQSQQASGRSSINWALAALAAGTTLFALVLGTNNYRLRLANQQLQQELLAAVPAQQAQLILQQPATRFYDFAGTDQAMDAFGSMIVDTDALKAAIAFKNLTPLPTAQTYALWVRHQGQYIPCGEFQTNPDGTVFVTLDMPPVYQARPWVKEVIVTIEPADLPAQPSGPIVVETI